MSYTVYRNIGDALDQLRRLTARENRARLDLDAALTSRQNLIWEAWQLGASMSTIADVAGVSRQRVGQIISHRTDKEWANARDALGMADKSWDDMEPGDVLAVADYCRRKYPRILS